MERVLRLAARGKGGSTDLNSGLASVGREEPHLEKWKCEDLDSYARFVWTRTVELGREGARVAVPTDFKAAFEADTLENIVVFGGGGGDGWLQTEKPKPLSDPE
jgi:hypothetical protein